MDHPFWHIAASAHDELCINLPSGGFLSLRVFPPFKLVLFGSGYRPRTWLLRRRLVPSCGDRSLLMRLLLTRFLLLSFLT